MTTLDAGVRRRRIGLAAVLVLGLGFTAGCDSFPSACRTNADCPQNNLCEQGECLAVSEELLSRCRPGDEAVQVPDLCNGLDDDCDGTIDESCTAGDDCTVGQGICARSGRLVEAGGGLTCSVEPGRAGVESCNGLDDDCDGRSDETCADGAPCAVGTGLCRRDGRIGTSGGQRVCLAVDGQTPLSPGDPVDEVCGDALDNDCDSEIDEGFDEDIALPCTAGQGICAQSGLTVCVDGRIRCSASPRAPEIEICDRADNDCDGVEDESFGTDMPCTVGQGACAASGTTICTGDGMGSVCSAVPNQPSAETCNGIDDDCDGIIDNVDEDEPLTQECGLDIGECRAGVQTCSDGRWGECEGAIGPVAEVCDGLDNDCNGVVDRFNEPCGSDVGACSFGSRECQLGEWTECVGGIGPIEETCNAIDDNCDGVVDNALENAEPRSLTQVCGITDVGECELGAQICLEDGDYGEACIGAIDPVDELCDGLDNDCDGSSDEEYDRLGTPCISGVGPCVSEGVFVCAPSMERTVCDAVPDLERARDEICNARDEDCDGRIDEDFFLGEPCRDAQDRVGTCVCGFDQNAACEIEIGGNPVLLEPVEAGGDGADDDCDGAVDEG